MQISFDRSAKNTQNDKRLAKEIIRMSLRVFFYAKNGQKCIEKSLSHLPFNRIAIYDTFQLGF